MSEVWVSVAAEFRKFHSHPLNVALHLVTTPAALFAASLLVRIFLGVTVTVALHVAWLLWILPTTPLKLWVTSSCIHGMLCSAAIITDAFTTLGASILFAVSYFAQDVAHFATCEPTFQSSYQGGAGWLWTLLTHTLHLVPLCIDACWHTQPDSLAALFVQRQQVVAHTLDASRADEASLLSDVELVGRWAVAQEPPEDKTTHWWWDRLSTDATAAFGRVARSERLSAALFEALYPARTHVVAPLEGMNEVYVACKTHNHNSDTVFYHDHVDGPYGLFPLVHVYRTMLAATPNEQIETVFPLAGLPCRHGLALSTGQMVAFDFHRELHRIQHVAGAKENAGPRVCLKVHHLVYPRALGPLGRALGALTVRYNANFRKLFLATIAPNSFLGQVMAYQVILFTALFNAFEKYVGWANVAYLGCVATAAILAHSYALFFCATSFVHYAVYAATYHQRAKIAFGAFKRDALLYKTLALGQAAVQFALHFDAHRPDGVALALLGGGFGLATLAASRLGVDRTYFGWELGEISGGYGAARDIHTAFTQPPHGRTSPYRTGKPPHEPTPPSRALLHTHTPTHPHTRTPAHPHSHAPTDTRTHPARALHTRPRSCHRAPLA